MWRWRSGGVRRDRGSVDRNSGGTEDRGGNERERVRRGDGWEEGRGGVWEFEAASGWRVVEAGEAGLCRAVGGVRVNKGGSEWKEGWGGGGGKRGWGGAVGGVIGTEVTRGGGVRTGGGGQGERRGRGIWKEGVGGERDGGRGGWGKGGR